MHYHMEIVMPPTEDVEAAIAQIMAPFDENTSERHAFWDWYVVGGRWSGNKLMADVEEARLKIFYDLLKEKNITVSDLRRGKERLQPESQIETVNKLWRKIFPNSKLKECPLFDNYKGGDGDIQKLGEVSPRVSCSTVIVAGLDYDGKKLKAQTMLQSSIWNGVTWQDSKWDGLLSSAIEEHEKRYERATVELKKKHIPKRDWLVVTVDYHS